MRRTLREEALLGAATPLRDPETGEPFGPPVLPFAPWHHLLMLGFDNPCFCGGPRPLGAVMQALWFLSPQFRAYSPLRYALFHLRWRWSVSSQGRPLHCVLAGLRTHFAVLTFDRPPLPVGRNTEDVDTDGPHELVHLEMLCRRVLGYSRSEFWHTPYAHTNQLLNLHFGTGAANMPKFNRKRDQQKKAWLARRRAERAQQGNN